MDDNSIAVVREALRELCNRLREALVLELEMQGHRVTGELINSIDVAVETMYGTISIVGRMAYYGPFVDFGRMPNVRRVPLDALLNWIRAKNIDLRGKKERQVAFQIMNAIWKRGIPSNRDQRKKRFMSGTLESQEQYIIEAVDTAFGEYMDTEITNLVERTQTAINSIQYHK